MIEKIFRFISVIFSIKKLKIASLAANTYCQQDIHKIAMR